MKISTSQVMFNVQQNKQTSEQYLQSSSISTTPESLFGTPVQQVIDLSYSAQMRAKDSSNVQANSQVKLGLNQASFEKTQATSTLTQTSIGITATISNVQINANSPTLLAPAKGAAYQEIAQLDIQRSTSSNTNEARVEIKEQYSFTQDEQLHVGTQGRVTTEDGREIDFMLQLEMSRSFELEESLQLQRSERQLMDPLVINFDGGAASLTSHSFSFDLNADGVEEQISFTGAGSGFLAIDKNQDGKINNGSELFGTGSKDGFADLAQYDLDNNKWIDENDEIFAKLKIWTKDESGQDQLISLKAAGVGAIYLGSVTSSFDLKDAQNNLLGQVKRSGIFLTERGEVASIQELDIAIRENNQQAITPGHTQSIELQINQWNQPDNSLSNQFVNLNVSQESNVAPADAEDMPTLIDYLFPKPGSRFDHSSKIDKTTHIEQQSETITTVNIGFEITPDPVENIVIERSSFDSLGVLEQKTDQILKTEQDKYNHLKAIIESLHKQHQQLTMKREQP